MSDEKIILANGYFLQPKTVNFDTNAGDTPTTPLN